MANASHIIDGAGGFHLESFGAALAVVTVCAFLIGFALSLPGRAPEGVILGIGTTLASMLATAQPGRWSGPLGLYAATAIACRAVTPRGRSPLVSRPFRFGGFWMAVPASVAAFAMSGRFLGLIGAAGACVIVGAAVRGRGRDLSVGYLAGLLVCLAALIASWYGQLAGAGVMLQYPPGLTGLIGLGCAARIGPDRAFQPWQRLAAFSIGAATLVAAGSPVAFMAGTIGCVTYLVWRLRATGGTGAQPYSSGGFVRVIGAGAPLVALAALWVASYAASRPYAADAHVTALARTVPVSPRTGAVTVTVWVVMVALAAAGAVIAWRVTGPELPVWVLLVGLTGVAGVLLGPAAVPSPGWVLALGAELWASTRRVDPGVIRTTRRRSVN